MRSRAPPIRAAASSVRAPVAVVVPVVVVLLMAVTPGGSVGGDPGCGPDTQSAPGLSARGAWSVACQLLKQHDHGSRRAGCHR
ncbi:hypothetical protein SCALM49S_05529 [Streptomyces californicus]